MPDLPLEALRYQTTTLRVRGEPVPQGSMRAFATGGKVVTVAGNAGRLARWRGDIRAAAAQAGMTPHDEPVSVVIVFAFERPKSHLLSHGGLRKGAPLYPRPDVDKLARAVLDALTGYAYRDDAQVVDLVASKTYEAEETIIIVSREGAPQ